MVRFERAAVAEIAAVGEMVLTVTGEMSDGTVFEGAGVIQVVDSRKYPYRYMCRPWTPPITWRFCRPTGPCGNGKKK
jgi:hypothetical protein